MLHSNLWFAQLSLAHDDVIKWKHFQRYWPFVRGIHRWPVNSPHKGQWHGGLIFSLICAWMNGWANNREAGDLRSHRAHYDITLMCFKRCTNSFPPWRGLLMYMRRFAHRRITRLESVFIFYIINLHEWCLQLRSFIVECKNPLTLHRH